MGRIEGGQGGDGDRGRSSAGTMLRHWRERVAGRSQRSVAKELGVSPSLWSGWESGHEPLGHARLPGLDRLFVADRALSALLEAATTPDAFDARAAWWFNVQGPSQPWWIWIRPSGDGAKVMLRWGPSVIPPLAVGPEGVVITTPVSMPNPPLSACFVDGTTGWVDMGPGRLPDALGLRILDGVSLMRSPTPDVGTFVVLDGARELLGRAPSWPEALRGLLGESPFLSDVLALHEAPNTSEDVSRRVGDETPPAGGADFARARVARGRSRAEVVAVANALEPDHPVSEHQVQRLEAGRDPRPCLLRSRLDSVYRADGHLACERVPVRRLDEQPGREVFEVGHPNWWIGPVWFAPAGSHDGLVPVRIEWGRWVKDVLLRHGQAVAARRPCADYPAPRVTVPRGMSLTAGIGRPPNAVDINKNWLTIDDRATAWLLAFTARNYLGAFGKSTAEAAEMVRGHHRALGLAGDDEVGDATP